MPTQGERQNFLWRPNDNSSTTLARYDLEAEHWTRAFNSAASKNRPTNFSGDLAVIGLVVNLVFSLILLVAVLLTDSFKFIHNRIKKANADQAKTEMYKNHFTSHNNLAKRDMRLQIEKILANRPKIFYKERTPLFRKAALMVVLKQNVSIPNLMFEFKIDFNETSKLIDELYEAGIISGFKTGEGRNVLIRKGRSVLIKDKKSLDLFYQMEKSFSV